MEETKNIEADTPEAASPKAEAKNLNEVITLPVSILISAALISASLIFLGWSNLQGGSGKVAVNGGDNPAAAAVVPAELMEVGDRDVILGDPKAPVTIIEYGDYQCPFCGRFFEEAEVQIRKNYIQTGKVRMVYRDMAFLGPDSVVAAQAAECAKDQQKFWAYHDALFTTEIADGAEHNGNLNRDLMIKIARDNNMDVAKFTQCYDAKTYATFVSEVTKDAQAAGINATPTIFVNGQKVQGAQPFSTFQSIIEAALKS